MKKRYYKEYNKIKNFRRLVIYLVLLVIFIVIINFIGLKCDFAKDKMQYFVNIKNPIIYMISISIFNIFLNIEIKIILL